MDEHITDAQIIDALGGTSEVARLCEVTPGAVSQWKTEGIPKPRLMFLRLARPKVFKHLHQQARANSSVAVAS
ncbi:Cro/CI family transcriptional regulator [Achromobacter sp. MFA1 R4]|uniref:Cro/CI family transcriptional regulator n=1 Tax=Achromobacter sp. MFA1 R4 TaxID=1881016 RepID=UPI0009537AF8|nr:Cro/CI family transcriptional regulator [Achromobacter sp. MFA1 R4]SIT27961.1 DNA-binding transcriptional regulator Cro [Achromobacter sp. MFA1 R4]